MICIENKFRKKDKFGASRFYADCLCDCGKQFTTVYYSLTRKIGGTYSCGCGKTRAIADSVRIHGLCRHPLYRTWMGMMHRCFNDRDLAYGRYAGRGITVSEELKSLEGFITAISETIGEKPSNEYSLDRVDNDGNYERGNLRWATTVEQARNRQKNVILTLGEVTQCQSAWAIELGMEVGTLYRRKKAGWSDEKALTRPIRVQPNNRKKEEVECR